MDPLELSLRGVVEAAADAEWEQARDILLGDAISEFRRHRTSGSACWIVELAGSCRLCDLIRRYEALTRLSTRVLDDFHIRSGDLGGGTA
jgi:hypothetical protein